MSLLLCRLAQAGLIAIGAAMLLAVLAAPGPDFLPVEAREMSWVLGFAAYAVFAWLAVALDRRRPDWRGSRGLTVWLLPVLGLLGLGLAAVLPLLMLLGNPTSSPLHTLGLAAADRLADLDGSLFAAIWQGTLARGIGDEAPLSEMATLDVARFLLEAMTAAQSDPAAAAPGIMPLVIGVWVGFVLALLLPVALLGLERPPRSGETAAAE